MLTCPACGRANPPEASFCMGCGGALGANPTPREVRKTVTALFCDLVGSTTLGESYDPEVLRPALQAYFAAMREAVERHGGRVEKFIGDAVCAVFGLPVAHEDDALRAVRAAMEMQARLSGLSGSSTFTLAARIGLATGEVLVPVDGSPLIGDAMNTAARLQAAAESGTVLIGEPTFRLVRDAVVAEPVEALVLKGKTVPVAAHRVVQVASLSPMRARRLDAPMVGRRRESALLASAFERATSERGCQLLTVLGSAGAGKSRLVEEFLAAQADGSATVLRGHCLPYGDGITWYPVTEALRSALGLPDFADETAIAAAIHAAVGNDEQAASIEANLLRLFGAGKGGSGDETFWAIRRFLETRAGERPLILVLDDIGWGEPTFLDFVEHLADWSRDARILVLCMSRPDLLDARPTWGGVRTNATTIPLAPLTEAETDRLIAGLLGSSAIPERVRARIVSVAGGNPLFVEEMLRMLVDDGQVMRDPASGSWIAAGDLADVHLPPTISALLSARLDRLSDAERSVLAAASVEGKEFHRGAIAVLLSEVERSDLDVHLRSLVRKELVSPERSTIPGEDAYRFRHLLIRDAAYDALPKRERAMLHAAFADWLEGVAGDRLVEQEAIVGHHLAAAHAYRVELGLADDRELRIRAARALGAAGTRALDDDDVRSAVELLRPAADLARDDGYELEVLDRLVDALREADDVGRRVALDRLADAAAAADDPVYAMRARVGVFLDTMFESPETADLDAAVALAAEALSLYREHDAWRFVPGALETIAENEWSLGHMSRKAALSSEALDVALDQGVRREVAWHMTGVMSALEFGPWPLSEALDRATGYLQAFAGDRAIAATALRERAWVNAWLGRGDEARADALAGSAIVEELGRRMDEFHFPLIDAYVAWYEGDGSLAERRFGEGCRILLERGDRLNVALFSPSHARVLLELDRDDEAEALLPAFRDNLAQLTARAHGLSIAALIAARRGDLAEALGRSDHSHALLEGTDCLVDQADVALDRAEVLLLVGRPDAAAASAQEAVAGYEHKEYAIGIRRAREFMAALEAQAGVI